MAFDPNTIPKDLSPINIARTVAEDPRVTTIRSPALGYNNVPGWGHVIANGAANAPVKSASSQASDEGLDESVVGKKVKFLCSFGGKIMPRPNDGMLRYIGGETRIVSVKRDVTFVELVNKMISTYNNQNVVIKYQLPDEDLDALVTVSCPDDLENMMDEYEKLVEKSSDGSAKLRVFLFLPSEVEKGRFGESQDSNKRYVEALNGLRRIDSLTSAASTQNSDFSNTEAIDSSNNVLSPKANSVTTQDPSPRVMNVDPRFVVETETSAAHLGVPIVPSAPQPVPTQHLVRNDIEMHIARNEDPRLIVDIETSSAHLGVPIVQSGPQAVPTHHPAPYFQTFVPAQHPMYTPCPQFHDNGSGFVQPQQYMPPVHMTVAPPPPSHLSMRPNMVLPVMQPQHDQFGPRIIQLPNGQSYHAFPARPSVIQSPQQQVVVGCDMCEKSLPHAHSDTVVQAQGQRASTTNPIIDTTSVYHSLHVNDKPRADLSGTTRIEYQYDNDRVSLQRAVNSDQSKAPFLQDVPMGFHHQQFQENAFQQLPLPTHHQYRQQIAMNPPVSNDNRLVHESPKKYSDILLATAPQEVAVDLYDNVREVERRMENLHIYPSESKPLVEKAFIKPPTDFDPNYLHSNEMSKPPLLGSNHPGPNEGSYTNFPLPVVDSIQVAERVQPVDWSRDPLQLQSKLLPTHEGGVLASVSPVKKVTDIQDSSDSLFSNQDPWNLQHDTHFPPPLPNKIALKKEGLGTRTPFDENQFCNVGELVKGNGEEARPELLLDERVSIMLDVAAAMDYHHCGQAEPLIHCDLKPNNVLFDNDMVAHVGDFGIAKILAANKTETQATTLGYIFPGSAEEQIKRDLQGVAEGVAASVLKSSIPSDPDLTKLERKVNVSEAIRDKNVRNDIEMQKARNEEIKTKQQEKAILGFPASDGLGRLQIIKNTDLEELRELGSGTFGTVYHGKWRGTDVAIKRINERCFAGKPSEIERMRDDFWNEAIKLADLHHPNVVAFYGVVLDGPGGSVATVTEYMVNGSLRTALQKNVRNLDKRKLLLIAMDVAFGMEYLHGKNIVHFDLKSDNLLVNLRDPHRPICKVGDLGLSKVKCQTLISGGVRGTLPWMAPELLNGSSSLVSEKVDVFSFGIVMWELLTGEEPYADLHYGTIIGGIVSNTLRPPVPESCDPEWRYLMERCWSAEPSERPNFTEIANELRVIATKVSSKAQNQQLPPSTQPQTKN